MRSKSKLAGILIALAGGAMVLPAPSSADLNGPSDTGLEGPYEIGIDLDASKVTPGPGDPAGDALMGMDTDAEERRVCFQFVAESLDPIVGASLHKGGPGEVGPSRLTLFESPEGVPGDGYYEGCVEDVRRRLIKRITKPARTGGDELPSDPTAQWGWTWYVEIHTEAFPNGAVRGQLGAGMPCPTCVATQA